MKVQILIDNRPDLDGRLFSEHGLCIYMEVCGKRVLVDTGLSGRAMDNARSLGVDIRLVDLVVLSHGHRDHSGGLGRLLEENDRCNVISCYKINEYDYTSDSHGKRHSLNPDFDVINRFRDRFVFISCDTLIAREGDNSLSAGMCHYAGHPRPRGNRLLRVNGMPYNGEDELIVTAVENGRMTVVSPCSHSGMGNIIECAERRCGLRCSTYIGGLHLIDGEGDLDDARISWPDTKIYTGHCTGMIAQERLRAMAGAEVFRTGDVIYC